MTTGLFRQRLESTQYQAGQRWSRWYTPTRLLDTIINCSPPMIVIGLWHGWGVNDDRARGATDSERGCWSQICRTWRRSAACKYFKSTNVVSYLSICVTYPPKNYGMEWSTNVRAILINWFPSDCQNVFISNCLQPTFNPRLPLCSDKHRL